MPSSNSRTKNTLYNAIGGISVKLITLITTFISRTVFLKVLGIQYAGVSSVFTDVLIILSFAELGIGQAITYALYKPIAEGDSFQIKKLMAVYKRIYTTIAFVVFGVGLCLIPFLHYIIKDVPDIVEDIRLIYVLYLGNTACSYLLIYKSTFLTAAQKDYKVSRIKAVIAVLKSIIECVLLLVFRNFIVYLVFSIMVVILQNFIVAKIAEREYPIIKEKSKERLNIEERRKLVSDVRALALYKVSGTVLNGTDSIITSSIMGTGVVGILGNYNLITNNVYSFVMQIFNATSASIGNLVATSTNAHQYKIFKEMLFLCFWIYCFCSTCLWVLFNPFMQIWQGTDRMFSQIVVGLLVADFYIKGVLSPVSQFRTSNGLFVQGKYRPVIMAIINIVVSIILCRAIGIAGIILGTIISRALTQLWYDPWLIYREVFKESVFSYFLTYIFYLILTAVSCFASQQLLNVVYPKNNIIQLFIGLGICIVVSNLVVVLVFHSRTEFKKTIQIIRNVLKKNL